MLRITFPYLLFISMMSLASSVLNSFGRFALPAFTPVLHNLTMIAAMLWLAPRFVIQRDGRKPRGAQQRIDQRAIFRAQPRHFLLQHPHVSSAHTQRQPF